MSAPPSTSPMRPRPSRRELEDELEAMIRFSTLRDAGLRRREDDRQMPGRFEAMKVLLPWLVTALLFVWTAAGQWTTVAGTSAKLDQLEQRIRTEYVTKDDFKHVADDVREIRQLLLNNAAADRRRARP